MAKLKDDHIKWVLEMDAKGVQSEITALSSQSKVLEADNKRLQAEYAAAAKQMKEVRKELDRLTKAGKEDSKEFKELEATLESVSYDMTDYKRKIVENVRAIEQNNKKVDEMVKTLRIEDMTMEQLKKRAKELQYQLDRTAEATHPEQYNALDTELTKVKNRMGELNAGSGSMFSVFKGGLMVLAGNLMTQAIDKVKELVKEGIEWVKTGIDMAKSAEGSIATFKGFENSNRILKAMKESTSGTISELKLMDKAIKANELGVPIEKMADLMDFARRQATKLRKDVDYMSESIVDGIGRKSTLILDNLGISATRVQAEVKKTGDFTQAVLKIVDEELARQGDYALTSADKAAQASAKWEDAQLKVGKKFKWLGDIWDSIKSKMADQINELAGDVRSLNEQYDDQLEKVADLSVNIEPLARRYDELKAKTSLNADEQAELNRIINTISGTIPGVITEFDKYGNALAINTGKVYDYIEAEKARLQFVNKEAIADYKKQKEKLQKEKDEQESIALNGKFFYSGGGMFGGGVSGTDNRPETLQKAADKAKELGKELQGVDAEIARLTGTTMDEQLNTQKNLVAKRQEFTAMNKKELKAWIADEKNAANEYHEIAKQIYNQKFGTNPDAGPGTKTPKGDKELQKQRKELNELREKLDITHNKKLAEINQDYLDGKFKSESEYNRKIFSQEQANFLIREQALKGFLDKTTEEELKTDVNKEITALQNQRLEREIKFQKELEQIILDANPIEKEKRAYEERLNAVGLYGVDREKLTETQLAALELLEEQHRRNIRDINLRNDARDKAEREKMFEESYKDTRTENQAELDTKEQEFSLQSGMDALTGDAAFQAELEIHNMRLDMIREEIEARSQLGLTSDKLNKELSKRELDLTKVYVNEFNRRKKEYTKYGQDIGNVVGNVITGQQDALSAFSGVMLDILFDTLTQIINAEITKTVATATGAIARTTAEQVASSGFLGIGKAAILTGIITAAMTVAKTALKGLIGKRKSPGGDSSPKPTGERVYKGGYAEGGYHGGYTGPGEKYDIRGHFPDGQPYHADEYIIPKEEFHKPEFAPMIRAIENSRRRRTNANPLPEGFAEGGYHTNGDTNGESDETRLLQMMYPLLGRLSDVMEEVRDKELEINYYTFEKAKNKVDRAREGAKKR